MDSDRLHAQTELLSKVARALADAATDPATLLAAVATQVAEALAAFCCFLRVSAAGDALEPVAMGVPAHQVMPPEAMAVLQERVPLAGESLLAKTVRSRATVQVGQVTETHLQARYADDASRDAARRFDTKGVMFVPVFVAGQVRGVLALVRRGPDAVPFDEGTRQLAERLAEHAALALANADLLHAARERSARLQLLSDLTRDVAAAANDYQRLLDVIVRRVGGAMADSCVLRVVRGEGDGLLGVAIYNRDPELEAFHRQTLEGAANRPAPLSDQVMATNRSVLIPRVHGAELANDGVGRTLLERLRPTTMLAVPLREGGVPSAVLVLARGVGGEAFTPADLALVEDVAAHATIAIANARAIERTAQAAARLRVLTEASAEFASAHGDPSQILETMAHRLTETLGGLCAIRILAADGVTLEAGGTVAHRDPRVVAAVRAVIGQPRKPDGFTRRILAGESIFVSGTPDEIAAQTAPHYRALIDEVDARSVIGVPLQAGALRLGTVVLVRAGGAPYGPDDLLMVSDMARHGALAVRNSRLLAALQHELAERQRAERALRASEEQLRHAQKMEAVGRLAGGVAHDFNNLLSVVLSSCDFIEQAAAASSQILEDVNRIRQAGVRAANLTRQLLAFSRQQVLERRVLDLNEQVTNMRRLLRRLLGEDCTVVTHLSPDLGAIVADATHVEQVVMNLALNSRDAMPRGGTLTIETANVEIDGEHAGQHLDVPAGRYVMLTVSDTGEGMPKEVQERIFEPFFTTKPLGKGTGLGLSTVFGIVKQNGGTIWVHSEPGVGTTLRVYFPRTDEVAKQYAPFTQDAPQAKGTETILVVEDEEEVLKTIVAILTRGGYRVIETKNATEALALYDQRSGAIDLLLTDVVMPVMSGPELVRCLRARQATLRILYMSGYTADALDPHDIPDLALLSKPFTSSTLLSKVRQILDAT